jgi:diaminohydroxyphosphoribosylaminopyrimidine deaminase/5-amino-6-(5-phosphoribosylamino)uracil reductase
MTLFSDPAVGIADPMLRRAFALAEHGRGTTSPNPLVGCVVVRDGVVVGEGFHERAGGPHAEVVALAAAGEAARGADVYVTLEPCNHFGKTPPCVDKLVETGVRSVTIGMADPSPEASGGAAALAAAGIEIHWATDATPFERQNEAWLTRLRLGRPFVRVKVALSLDGRPALAVKRRSKITGAGGRAVTMQLRRQATAVVVGASTVAIDDPMLTVRDETDECEPRTPRRVVLSRTSVPSPGACVFQDGAGCTLVTSTAASRAELETLAGSGARILTYAYTEALHGALAAVAADGIDDVLVEAGPSLFSALWRERLIDELVVVTAGGMSGNGAPALFLGQPDAQGNDLTPVFVPVETGIVERDVVTVWRPAS